MNKVILSGRVAKAIEANSIERGNGAITSTANVRLAVKRNYSNANREVESDFFRVDFYGTTADNIIKYVKVGDLIEVEAKLKNISWEQDGVKHYADRIVGERVTFLQKGPNHEQAQGYQQEPKRQETYQNPFASQVDVDDNDLPF